MEIENPQWVAKEEEQEEVEVAALEGRQKKKPLIESSSSSSSSLSASNGGGDADTNGVSYVATVHDQDEAIVQKEEEVAEMGDVSENGVKNEGFGLGLGLVAEFMAAETNGEATSVNNAAVGVAAASQIKNSVYCDKQEGSEASNGPVEVQNGNGILLTDNGLGEFYQDIQKSLSNETNNKYMKTVKDNGISSPDSPLLLDSFETKATEIKHSINETIAKVGSEIIEDIDQRLKDFDVELVLAKQETHDLFCPNCRSCITKRVVLKKRKRSRSIPEPENESKPDELETEVSSKRPVGSSLDKGNEVGHANLTSDYASLEQPPAGADSAQGPDLFRCLECFSFFISRGKDFFRSLNFGGAPENKTSQITSNIPSVNIPNPSEVVASKGDGLSALPSFMGTTQVEQGETSHKPSKTGAVEQSQSSSKPSDVCTPPENPDSVNGKNVPDIKPGHVVEGRNDSADIKNTGVDANLPSKNIPSVTTTIIIGEMTNTALILKPHEGERDFPVASNEGSKVPQTSQDIDKTPKIDQNGYPSFIVQPRVPTKISSDNDLKLKEKEEITPPVVIANKGDAVIILVGEEKTEPAAPQTGDTSPVEIGILTEPIAQVHDGGRSSAEIGEPVGWEIVKSIVYGGLIESITSLGIVSSAASSGAAPLNIIALGLANLIAGLFVIGDNIIDLKNEQPRQDQQQANATEDRYQELLGRRANFILHAVVAVLSFIIFGAVPIVMYGFLINKTYKPEVKLAAVAATSLFCILLLAIGKVYTQKPPKSYAKTVLYYLTTAVAASGASYIAGGLAKDLLEKFSHSESGSGFLITMPFSGTGTMDPAWKSY